MSLSLALSTAWVFASVAVAMLPMRLQYAPGLLLLLAAPALIVFLGFQHGMIVSLLGAAAFVSMFRNPLIYVFRRLTGRNPGLPK